MFAKERTEEMKKDGRKAKNFIKRVDVQVSILCASLVVSACLGLFIIFYAVTYNSMIESLVKRTEAVYEFLEESINQDSYGYIQDKEDMDTEGYQKIKKLLEEVRESSAIRYLYTAKKAENNTYIYAVDGLDKDSEDFRYPGDVIEAENIPDIERAYQGEVVLPHKILNTAWGKIFLAYYPIYDNTTGEVVGVLGMEFDAEQQYNTYRDLKFVTPVIIVFICILAMLIAAFMFNRISNPRKNDLYNTDQLTQLKSRNAFEFDFKNMSITNGSLGIGILDLDYLKRVNDTQGHTAGDLYIKYTARAIKESLDKNFVGYRTGGDEFVVLVPSADERSMQEWEQKFRNIFYERVKKEIKDAGVSVGTAIYTKGGSEDLYEAYQRADEMMYQNKHKQ